MKEIANVNLDYIIYKDGTRKRWTPAQLKDLRSYALQQRIFYSRYVMELENELKKTNDPTKANIFIDLIGYADAEYTKYYNISDKLTTI